MGYASLLARILSPESDPPVPPLRFSRYRPVQPNLPDGYLCVAVHPDGDRLLLCQDGFHRWLDRYAPAPEGYRGYTQRLENRMYRLVGSARSTRGFRFLYKRTGHGGILPMPELG